jgi:hypothetical protein
LGDLRDIHINDLFTIGINYEYYVDFRLVPYANGSGTFIKSKRVDFNDSDVVIYIKTPISYKLLLAEKDKLSPVITASEYEEHYPDKSIEEVFKIPHDEIDISEYGYQEGSNATSPHKALKERSVIGWHVSYNAFDITSMYAVISHEKKGYTWSDEVNEYRYAKNGKLYRIEGRSYSNLIGSITYSVYFDPNGSSKRDFNAYPEGITIEQFEKEMEKTYQKQEEFKEDIKAFKNSMAYIKHILSASHEELQKEFDAYKKSVILLEAMPSTISTLSPSVAIGVLKRPCVVSYFNRWALVARSPEPLMATTSNSCCNPCS